MSRFVALTRLALQELWISFRLLLVLAALLMAVLPPALLPHAPTPDLAGAPPDPLAWFALALAGALTLAATLAAATLASERRRGTAGWLASWAVPRVVILLTWFAAFGALLVAGLALAGALAWISVGGGVLLPDAGAAFVAALLATACAGLAAVALGLAAGSLLPPAAAGLLTALLAGALLVGAAVGPPSWLTLPAGGLSVLATLEHAARPIADASRAGGAALLASALLIPLAAAGFELADL